MIRFLIKGAFGDKYQALTLNVVFLNDDYCILFNEFYEVK